MYLQYMELITDFEHAFKIGKDCIVEQQYKQMRTNQTLTYAKIYIYREFIKWHTLINT